MKRAIGLSRLVSLLIVNLCNHMLTYEIVPPGTPSEMHQKEPRATTVNYAGDFHNLNLSRVKQGDNCTVIQGDNFNITPGADATDIIQKFLKEFVALCHPGTRESVLKTMRNWVDNPNSKEKIIWLHGP